MNETSASCVICWRSGHVTSMMQLITGPSALSMAVARFGEPRGARVRRLGEDIQRSHLRVIYIQRA